MVKKSKIITFFIIFAVLVGIVGSTTTGIVKKIKLGLDLQGGFEVLYDVKPAKEGQTIDKDTLKSAVRALDRRVNALGVSEPNITIEGKNRIRVQLAGVKDENKARKLLSTKAQLTFRDVNDKVLLDGSDLKGGAAKVTYDQNAPTKPIVQLTLNDGNKFGKVTKQVLGMGPGKNQLVIWLDYAKGDSYAKEAKKEQQGKKPKYISAPAVNQELDQKTVVIEGRFSQEEANNLRDILNAGALPVKLDEVYSNSVGAKFGKQALDETVTAGIIGIIIVYLFMIFYYRFPGLIAIVTLSFYIYLNLLIFYWMGAVLTLPGIAAFILGVGMAVDANIITAERIKEEIRSGKSIMSAYKAGTKRSFAPIFDANLTSIITASVLFAYGTSSVKGFALVLIVSVITSFFTNVYVSRILLGLWVNSKFLNKKPRYFGVKESDIHEL
ncbi:bifunctional preprotein translocase subunit SecD/SecF [Fictibacillus macauensis ZFHKF-1]|uniref:Protein translocase subunit SecD n=1 Tax=Fictibacillus macauensis ZFHKF-1 TaxID=1196324 RepID=I8J0M6_9BACL|nr:bifunctional preprotein translocase subunit SecD/SecF [Fictibacillus macauensis ZFHKF-1]